MEHFKDGDISRRAFLRGCLGGLATLGTYESLDAAPPPETNGGGLLCTAPPNEEGVLRLEAIHENALDDPYSNRYEVAERYGLTLVPREEVLEFIERELLETQTVLESTYLLNTFIWRHFGMQIFVNEEYPEENSFRYLENPKMMIDYYSELLKNLCLLPKEFYEAVGLTDIIIEDLPKGVGGTYSHTMRRIKIDIFSMRDAKVLYHELGHAINLTGCGDFEDVAIAETLPDEVQYTDEAINEELSGDIFVEPYGQKNHKEDAATITAAWMTGQISLSDEIEGTPVYEKLAIIMDRFDTLVPGMVEYVEEGLRPAFQRKA